jgi:aqualysin 1
MTSSTPVARTLAAVLVLAAGAGTAVAQGRNAPSSGESRAIEGQYIVVYKRDSAANPAVEAGRTANRGGRVHHVYTRAVRGFTASVSEDEVRRLRNDPDVELVEQDRVVSIDTTQAPATWGLDRIDQADRPLDTSYQYTATGAGVTAFVIDTGILPTHGDFTGRLQAGMTTINDRRGTQDCNGHGTHVAGTIGGTTWGVAKQVKLVPVRVLDCRGNGSFSGVIAGIDWVASHPARPAVANLSLGGSLSAAVNKAVAGAVAKGVVVVVAAGNSAANACSFSPASEPTAITVGATTSGDTMSSFSNWGPCVDIFAPGQGITSAWHTGSTATNTISGTSMASPHVAGAAALVLEANPSASPAAVADFLLSSATPDRLASVGTGSPNLLLFSLAGGVAPEPVQPTVAVAAVTGQAARAGGRQWRATVTVKVRNLASNAAVQGATVTGSFAPGSQVTCVTGATGTCSVSSTYANGVLQSKYTVGSVSVAGATYDPTQDSAAEVIVNRP